MASGKLVLQKVSERLKVDQQGAGGRRGVSRCFPELTTSLVSSRFVLSRQRLDDVDVDNVVAILAD